MGKRTGRLRFRDIAHKAMPRAGGWVARVCRSCRRLAGLRPVAGARAPRTSLPGPWLRAGEWVARVCRSCRCLAGLRPGAGKMPALPGHRSRGRGSGGGVGGSGVSLLSAPCGPSARCGQDARAPRTSLPGAVARAGEWVARVCSRHVAPVAESASEFGRGGGLPSALCGPSARCGQDARAPRTSLPGHGSGGGVGGSGVSLLSAPCGPSARCGQDARAPRTSLPDIAPGAVPRVGEWNVPDRLRADRQYNQTHIELTRPRNGSRGPRRDAPPGPIRQAGGRVPAPIRARRTGPR